MHIYLIKSIIYNNIVHVFGASDNNNAVTVMHDYYLCFEPAYYLERVTSYISEEI